MNKKKLIPPFVLSAILIFLMIVIPQMIGLGKGGFEHEEVLRSFFFYSTLGTAFLVGLLVIFGIEFIIRKGDARYGSSILFASQGEKPAINLFKKFTVLQIILLSLIIFPSLALLNHVTTQTTFVGLAVLPQQFTAVDSLLYSTFLIPISENLGAAFVLALGLLGLRYWARKTNMSAGNFAGLTFFLILAIAGYGVVNHLMRYGASDYNILVVFIFWGLGAFITILTGTFIPFWIMHLSNNLFFDLGRFFSNELMLIWAGGIIMSLVVLYLFSYRGRLLGRKGVQ